MANPAAVAMVANPNPRFSRVQARRWAPMVARCSSREADHTRNRLGLATGIAPRIGPTTRSTPATVIDSGTGAASRRDHQPASVDVVAPLVAADEAIAGAASWRTCQDSRAMIEPTARIRKPFTGWSAATAG